MNLPALMPAMTLRRAKAALENYPKEFHGGASLAAALLWELAERASTNFLRRAKKGATRASELFTSSALALKDELNSNR